MSRPIEIGIGWQTPGLYTPKSEWVMSWFRTPKWRKEKQGWCRVTLLGFYVFLARYRDRGE